MPRERQSQSAAVSAGALSHRLMQPPFATELQDACRRGRRVNVFVFAGDHAARRATNRPAGERLYLPPDAESPDAFDWTCVRGLELMLVVWNRPPQFTAAYARLRRGRPEEVPAAPAPRA